MKKIILLSSFGFLFLQCGNKFVHEEISTKEVATISSDSLHSYATETKKLLMKNVGEQIQKGGPESALEFCNIEAMPLTKSMSDKHGLVISRVSDKNRNPKNIANAEELKLIEQHKIQLLAGELLKPVRTETHYYEPLVTNAMCLQCHGEPSKNVQPKVAAKIAELYPNDLAMGYKENEVRGLISIKTK
ncbi:MULTISPECIES: DUF3365 domain-containing protein [unclassified Kaistella]|uniref:Tll0287-like domain-containing protein n=1 Tax=unclassified Kaistella TaxID=2762626 RepID=UPI002733BE91|nr:MULTISPECIES: DUF3365 domain-containing protein [unclassified Kaistella]MDP2453186.1 DUF3365 domain-containing protein [Kaistella sp. SH11-4b]MDP2456243.1 DUF3365 domain-containing protein [Kaistella sp. SH40-3]MDP2458999.1 DUF3365 domain-containing protein [Kaistella sp. SH19-2b]